MHETNAFLLLTAGLPEVSTDGYSHGSNQILCVVRLIFEKAYSFVLILALIVESCHRRLRYTFRYTWAHRAI